MSDNLNQPIIQQSREGQYNLKRISELNEISENNNNTNLLNEGYLLLTKPHNKNYIFKVDLITDKIKKYINSHIAELLDLDELNINIDSESIKSIVNGYLKYYAKKSYVDSEINEVKVIYGKQITEIKNKLGDLLDISYDDPDSNIVNVLINEIKDDLNVQFDYIYEQLNDRFTKDQTHELINNLKTKHDIEVDNLRSKIDLNNTSTIGRIDILEARIAEGIESQQLLVDGINVIVNGINENIIRRNAELDQYMDMTDNKIDQLSSSLDELQNNKNNIITRLQHIENELIYQNDEGVDNSRIDKLENMTNNIYTKDQINQFIQLIRDNHISDFNNLNSLIDLNNTSTISRLDILESRISESSGQQDLVIDGINAIISGLIDNINDKNTQHTQDINNVNNRINNIENEITTNIDGILNSRIDKLETMIDEIKENGYTPQNPEDLIDHIEWINFGIISPKQSYINDETFTFSKGDIIAYYTNNTTENVTSKVTFNITGGILNNDRVTTGNNEGSFYISVSYNGHTANERINYQIVIPKYYNYFLLIDEDNINNLNVINNNLNNYCINKSFDCPMVKSRDYMAYNLIIDKFYNGNNINLDNKSLYMVIPSQYVTLQNSKIYFENGTLPLKSNIFEISGITLYQTQIINEPCYNISEYNSKQIEYSIFLISSSINTGIQLKY